MSKQTLASTNTVSVSIDFITQQMLYVVGLKPFSAKTDLIDTRQLLHYYCYTQLPPGGKAKVYATGSGEYDYLIPEELKSKMVR
jgi:hypothetical protein